MATPQQKEPPPIFALASRMRDNRVRGAFIVRKGEPFDDDDHEGDDVDDDDDDEDDYYYYPTTTTTTTITTTTTSSSIITTKITTTTTTTTTTIRNVFSPLAVGLSFLFEIISQQEGFKKESEVGV
uniref:Uncharacterized protein n=1 Tax=Vespula pensylvanica TaxID=30213 RepID=A0A834KNH1_VESPE|nr:hypothetical protein H0235_013853 [Vespula pensylvanica]